MKTIAIGLMVSLISSCAIFSSSTNAASSSRRDINELSVGDEYLGGIIFYIFTDDDGNLGGLILSKTETLAAWQDNPVLVNATSTVGGHENYELMKNSPAKNWILENFSKEWYLPTIDELMVLWIVRYQMNEALEAGDHTPLSPLGTYWSSREYGERNAYFLNFDDGDPYTDNKQFRYNVRAIRAF